MNQAQQYELLQACIQKMQRLQSALLVDVHVDYAKNVDDWQARPDTVFPDGSRLTL